MRRILIVGPDAEVFKKSMLESLEGGNCWLWIEPEEGMSIDTMEDGEWSDGYDFVIHVWRSGKYHVAQFVVDMEPPDLSTEFHYRLVDGELVYSHCEPQ